VPNQRPRKTKKTKKIRGVDCSLRGGLVRRKGRCCVEQSEGEKTHGSQKTPKKKKRNVFSAPRGTNNKRWTVAFRKQRGTIRTRPGGITQPFSSQKGPCETALFDRRWGRDVGGGTTEGQRVRMEGEGDQKKKKWSPEFNIKVILQPG